MRDCRGPDVEHALRKSDLLGAGPLESPTLLGLESSHLGLIALLHDLGDDCRATLIVKLGDVQVSQLSLPVGLQHPPGRLNLAGGPLADLVGETMSQALVPAIPTDAVFFGTVVLVCVGEVLDARFELGDQVSIHVGCFIS